MKTHDTGVTHEGERAAVEVSARRAMGPSPGQRRAVMDSLKKKTDWRAQCQVCNRMIRGSIEDLLRGCPDCDCEDESA